MADLRMPDLNRVMLAGRLTRDPELKYGPTGVAVCELGMAVSRKYRTKEGETKEDVVFVNVTCWGKTAEYVGENFKKGRAVLVEGRLTLDKWETKGGEKRTSLMVTADRVQSIQWDETDGGKANVGRKDQAPAFDEDDIPF